GYAVEEAKGGPNFYPWARDARYDINIDNDGDAMSDLTYRLTFKTEDRRDKTTFLYNNGPVTSLDDANLLFRQTYRLELIDGRGRARTLVESGRVAPPSTRPAPLPPYTSPGSTPTLATPPMLTL